MNRTFRTLSTKKIVDLKEYIQEYIQLYPDLEILIGCDSQNHKRETVYAIVIGLYRPRKGAHVLYNRSVEPRYYNSMPGDVEKHRLLNEVWYSVEIAEYIKAETGIVTTWIDIDLNPDPIFKSNKALAEAVGLVVGMGYHVRHKGLFPLMTYCADDLVKRRKASTVN